MTIRAEEYKEEWIELKGVSIFISTYRMEEIYHCHVASAEPGAVIARASAGGYEEAKQKALKKTMERLK